MSTEVKKEIQLEIGHVLFIDIVGYSKLSVKDQHAAVEQLNQIVRASEQFQRADSAGRLLKVATGDEVYQAILERRPLPAISRLQEILAKPDPALGFYNGELRFWLGWAQKVAGDHAAAKESWRQARSELESFLREQPENYQLIEDLALTNMGLGDKAAAFSFVEKAMAVVPIEKDAVDGPSPTEVLARVSAQMGEPDRAIAALQKLLSIPYEGALAGGIPLTPALLRLDPCSIRCEMIRASRNSSPQPHQRQRANKATRRSAVSSLS